MPLKFYIFKDPMNVVRISTINPNLLPGAPAEWANIVNARTRQRVNFTDFLPLTAITSQLHPLQNSLMGQTGDEAVIEVEFGT